MQRPAGKQTRRHPPNPSRGQAAILSAVSYAAERFLRVGDWRQAMHEVMARLGTAAGVDRVVLFEKEPSPRGDLVISRRYEWARDANLLRPDGPLQHIALVPAGFTRWIGLLEAGHTIASNVRQLPDSEQPTLLAQDIQSVLVVPVLVDMQFWGFIGFDACTAERAWSAADKTALSAGARIIGEAIRHERTEQAQRESEARFQAVTESATDAIVVFTADGRIVLWNRGAERLYQYRADEAIGQSMLQLIAEPFRAMQQKDLDRLRLSGIGLPDRAVEAVSIRKDGTRFPVEVTLAHWREGNELLVGAIVRDITERKEAESALQRRKRELREAQRIARLGSWEWDVTTGAITWSAELYFINRYDPDLPVPSFAELERFYVPESWARLRAAVDRTLRTGEPYELDLEQVRVDGTRMWTVTRGESMRDAHGRIVGLRGTVLDNTDRKLSENALRESEARLRQAQKMEAVGQLAGGVAHDFNNLLTAICGYADLVMEGLDEGSQIRADVAEIKKAGERAAGLTRQLLAFGRKQINQPKVLDLGFVLSDVEAMLRRVIGEDIALTTSIAPSLAHVYADPGQIEQILLNLSVNARDAMPNGGELAISALNAEADVAFAHRYPDARPGRYAVLVVRDTGCGMSPDVQAHMFEPFFTTKGPGKGTGLGLSTVYGIVKQSGGFIDVCSEVGRGTTFSIYLPETGELAEPAGQDAASGHMARATETALLVEDESSVRALARRTLQRAGYQVLETSTPQDAIEVSQSYRTAIDLLITDMILPGMNGCELARKIAAGRTGLKVLLMSGYAKDAVGETCQADKQVPFLQKPFTPAALLEAVRRALDAQPLVAARPDPTAEMRITR